MEACLVLHEYCMVIIAEYHVAQIFQSDISDRFLHEISQFYQRIV